MAMEPTAGPNLVSARHFVMRRAPFLLDLVNLRVCIEQSAKQGVFPASLLVFALM